MTDTSTSLNVHAIVPRSFAYPGRAARSAPSCRQVAITRKLPEVQRTIRQAERDFRLAILDLITHCEKHGIKYDEHSGSFNVGDQPMSRDLMIDATREQRDAAIECRQAIIGLEHGFFEMLDSAKSRGCTIPSVTSAVSDTFDEDLVMAFKWHNESKAA